MRLFYVINVHEFETRLFGLRFSNRFLCALFAIAQCLFVVASFVQHIYSWFRYRHVFFCRSNISYNATFEQRFLAYDLVIFDFGLMHRILGTNECVANYLDGGYMRCSWCIQHAGALSLLLVAVGCMPTPIWLLWPALFMQSSYVLGMSILTMATMPKLLEAFSGFVDHQLGTAFIIYAAGFSLNWLFTFILWHYYWGIEAKYSNNTSGIEKSIPAEEGEPHPEPV
ncbi:hypothetical protein DdX_07795 [Ditylenchus destructor]|uniref:Uncharacterized protein n=1 Tax=Ditylenchus destructor TaxID=166010 RepID=A0AAD4R7J9_9BILA|nr:hypothetical protein DdX_07795 [Ditylenchus destructor]